MLLIRCEEPLPTRLPWQLLAPEEQALLARWRPPPRLSPPRFVQPVPADPTGRHGPTRGQARGRRWRRTSPNRWVPADAECDQPAQRIVEQAELLPRLGGVTGWAGLHLAGARWFAGADATGASLPVPLAIGPLHELRYAPGVEAHRQTIHYDDLVVRHGIRCVSVHRSLFDEMVRLASAREAAIALEMVMFAELTSLRRFASYVETRGGKTGVGRVREALAMAVEGPASPQESRTLRVWELDAELPRPLCNADVFGPDGAFLGRPDLLDPVAGLVVEYDGAHHRETHQRARDIEREERLRSHGLEYLSIVGGQLTDRHTMAERMIAARRRALRWRRPQTWTLAPPPGTLPPLTLDERLDLHDLVAETMRRNGWRIAG